LDAGNTDAMDNLMRLYLKQKQPAKALAAVQAQIARAPNNSNLHLLAGRLYVAMHDNGKAEAALEKSVALDANNVQAFLLLGKVETSLGSVDKAIANYERSIQANPMDVGSYILLATLQEKKGDWQKAQGLYLKALQVRPDYPLAANNLAYLLLQHGGNTDVALSYAQVARRGLPEAAFVADTLGWAYYQKGNYELASQMFQEAVKKTPNDPAFQHHLGLAYQKTNDPARAREHLERVLQIDPHYPQAAEVRKALAELKG
jgi:tetratricopeptide (TPR) repeat protein